MVRVEAIKSKNCLLLGFTGIVKCDEITQSANSVEAALKQLEGEFCLVTDLTGLKSMDAECAREIGTMMDLLEGKGLKTVARVIPDPTKDIGLTILSRFHYGPEIETTTYETLKEAMKSLPG